MKRWIIQYEDGSIESIEAESRDGAVRRSAHRETIVGVDLYHKRGESKRERHEKWLMEMGVIA